MTTPWYYDHYEAGKFPYQQKLCDAIRWTKYNLEGQKLIRPNHLSAIQANPLTIRLLALNEALKHFNNAKTINKKINERAREQFDKNKFFTMSGTWKAESSSSNTQGAPIETIEISGEEEPLQLRHVDIHLALYEFFTNFGSVIDRLTHEIDKVNELNIPRRYLYWTKLTSNCELDRLSRRNEALATLLGEYHDKFYIATRYRNRLIHDGIVRLEVDYGSFKGLIINLARDPDDDTSPFDVNAISFCEQKKEEVLRLLNESYKLMLQYYKNEHKEETHAAG